MTNKLITNTYRRNNITHCWSFAGFHIALKREGEKDKKKKKKLLQVTRGIRIWSPIKVLTPPTGLNFVERTRRGTVLKV